MQYSVYILYIFFFLQNKKTPTSCFQAVTHPNTNYARRFSTSVFGRKVAYLTWFVLSYKCKIPIIRIIRAGKIRLLIVKQYLIYLKDFITENLKNVYYKLIMRKIRHICIIELLF